MIIINVSDHDIDFAKKQIAAFEKIDAGQWRYTNVEAWRGIVCEMLAARWLEENFDVSQQAKGLDNSGIVDNCDMVINDKKIEIKSATKNYFCYLMPKIHDVISKPKDIYIGVKYNKTVSPNQIQILGYIKQSEIVKFPIKQNKGAPYYEVPLSELLPITKNTFE